MYNPWRMVGESWRCAREVRTASGVPVRRQIGQLLTLRRTSGMSRAEYYLYRLWRPGLSLAERLQYTTLRERRLTELLRNPVVQGRRRIEGKTWGAQKMAAAGVPVPDHLAEIAVDAAAIAAGVPVVRTPDAFAAFLAAAPPEGLVIKPEHGFGGRGVLVVVAATRSGIVLASGEHRPVAAVWRELTADPLASWRLERRILAHPVVAAWRPDTTPTVRLITAVVDGQPVVHAGMMKVIRNPRGVDNFHAGNLAAGVDLLSGRIGPAVDPAGTQWFERHPDSGAPIAGIVIPDWPRYLAAARAAAAQFEPLSSLGWDVAVSRDGPVILEANTSWEEIVQLPLDRGILHGAYARLWRDVGAGWLLDRRERACPGWTGIATALE